PCATPGSPSVDHFFIMTNDKWIAFLSDASSMWRRLQRSPGSQDLMIRKSLACWRASCHAHFLVFQAVCHSGLSFITTPYRSILTAPYRSNCDASAISSDGIACLAPELLFL